jgi:hypothetical protein
MPLSVLKFRTEFVRYVVCGCETWSHTEAGTEAEGFQNRVLRERFGPMRDEVTGDWRRLHDEKI